MVGILAGRFQGTSYTAKSIAKDAVRYTDALLAELERTAKEQEPNQ